MSELIHPQEGGHAFRNMSVDTFCGICQFRAFVCLFPSAQANRDSGDDRQQQFTSGVLERFIKFSSCFLIFA